VEGLHIGGIQVAETSGTFSALGGGTGVDVEVRWWDASGDELAELGAGVAAVLRAGCTRANQQDPGAGADSLA
jgi:hypothetical protein